MKDDDFRDLKDLKVDELKDNDHLYLKDLVDFSLKQRSKQAIEIKTSWQKTLH